MPGSSSSNSAATRDGRGAESGARTARTVISQKPYAEGEELQHLLDRTVQSAPVIPEGGRPPDGHMYRGVLRRGYVKGKQGSHRQTEIAEVCVTCGKRKPYCTGITFPWRPPPNTK